MTKDSMNTQSPQGNNELFGSLIDREASVTLSDLQRYVASAPAPTASYARYMVVGVIVLLIGTGIFYFSGNTPSQAPTMVSEIAVPQSIVPQSVIPQPALPEISPSVSPSPKKQIVAPQASVAVVSAKPATHHSTSEPTYAFTNDGLREKPEALNPMMGVSEQSVMASNDPSIYVTIATIEFPESSGQYQ